MDDPQHPRGYREIRSNGEMRKLMDRKIAAQNGICPLCKERFTDYGDIVPDHINPRGMGGAWRDDHPDNIQAGPTANRNDSVGGREGLRQAKTGERQLANSSRRDGSRRCQQEDDEDQDENRECRDEEGLATEHTFCLSCNDFPDVLNCFGPIIHLSPVVVNNMLPRKFVAVYFG